MPTIDKKSFDSIVAALKPHQAIAVQLAGNNYGYSGPTYWSGIKPTFDISAIAAIGERIKSFDVDINTRLLAAEYNNLLDQVLLRNNKAIYHLDKIYLPPPQPTAYTVSSH